MPNPGNEVDIYGVVYDEPTALLVGVCVSQIKYQKNVRCNNEQFTIT